MYGCNFQENKILTSQTKVQRFFAVSENAAHKYLFAELQNALCVQKLELLAVHRTFLLPVQYLYLSPSTGLLRFIYR